MGISLQNMVFRQNDCYHFKLADYSLGSLEGVQIMGAKTITCLETREHAVEVARDLAPLARELARRADDERHLPNELIDAFRESGLAGLLVPKRFGGSELDLTTHLEVDIELGKACGSFGWVGSFFIDHAFILAHFDEKAQADVWEHTGPGAFISASFVPVGKVTPASGGWTLSGDWSWGSGATHADWLMLGGVIHSDNGNDEFRLFLIPATELTVVDTWFSAGLSGSGSDNVVAEDVFVPDYRTVAMDHLRDAHSPGAQVHANKMYNQPFMSYGGHAMVSPAIGIARGVVEAWEDHVRSRANSYTREQVASSLPMQLTLARSTAQIDCAEMLVRRALEKVDRGDDISLDDRIRARRDMTFSSRLLMDAVQELMQMAGASALRADSPIQRGWRDIRAVSCHVFCNFNAAAENYGRHVFGFPLNPNDPFF